MLNQTMEDNNLKMIQTEIIKPIQANQQSATFVFRNVGLLSRHTRITLKAISEGSNDAYYPMSTGIASLVRSAKLMCNGKILMQNERVAETIAMNSQFQPTQFRKHVQRARIGTYNTWTTSRVGVIGTDNNQAGKIIPEGINFDNNTAETSATASFASPYNLTNSAETSFAGYLSMEDLFPRAYTGSQQDVLQLPLMYLTEEVSLVLTFNRGSATEAVNNQHRALPPAGGALNTAFSVNIVLDELNMLVDYLHYEDNSRIAKQVNGQGLSLTFGDYDINTFHLAGLANPADVKNTATYNLLLGLNEKTIRQLYFMFTPDVQNDNAGDAHKRQNLFNGRYCSPCPARLPNGVRLNLKINGQNLYVNPIENYAEHCNRLSSAYGVQWDLPFSTYCHWDVVCDELDALGLDDGGGDFDVGDVQFQKGLISQSCQVKGHSLVSADGIGMNGAFFYMGVNLQKSIMDTQSGNVSRLDFPNTGTTVGSVPVQIALSRDIPEGLDNDNRNLLVVAVVEKTLFIRSGTIEVL